MKIERNIGFELVRATEAAALRAARWMGRGDKNSADQAAVDAMRFALDTVDMDGVVVIGEGEKDEAPMLYIGEQLGNRFEFWNYVRAEAVDVLQPNVWKVGGITEWLKIAHLAQHANLAIAPHNSLELSCHLVAGVANGFMVENIFGGNLSDLGVVEEPVPVSSGKTRLPDRPGHGVAFRTDELAQYELDPGEAVDRVSSVHAGL